MLYTEKTIGALFREQAALYADRDFMIYPDRETIWESGPAMYLTG